MAMSWVTDQPKNSSARGPGSISQAANNSLKNLFIHLFKKFALSTKSVLGTILGAEDTAGKKTEVDPGLSGTVEWAPLSSPHFWKPPPSP